jgi:subtilase family serine protease
MGQKAANRAAGQSRIGPIDDAQVVTLLGNVHPLAREEFDRGPADAETELGRMMLELDPSAARQAELDALVAAQHDPHSPLYRQWLTPTDYGARFGASPEEVARVAAWLEGHGFTVEEIPVSNRLIVFSGTAAQVAESFHTRIHRYRVDGTEHIANSLNPRIPVALAGVVGGVVSLHDFRRRSLITTRTALATEALPGLPGLPSFAKAQPLYTSGSTHYLFPADWAAIYDLNPVYGAGTAGAGISIAIAGRSNIDVSDVAAFRAMAGLAAKNPTVILAGADPGLVEGDRDEATLDVEWGGAVAPAAAVTLVAGESTGTTDGVDLAAEYIVNHALAPVMSTSYGSCEQEMGAAELAFYNSLWEQAASQGMSSLVASGDSGAAGCYAGSAASGSGTAVNGLCTSPFATCVGGTEFNEGSNPAQYWAATNAANYGTALGYIPEEVWNESGLNGGIELWASGGGASVVYAQPAWQKAVTGTSAANGMRAVPDVSVTAAAHDGYVLYENGSYYVASGTSAASPSFAGVMALVVQQQGGTGVGNANPGLYSLLSAARAPFHATPSGNNSVPGVTGFTASGAEYNLATGLGSVDGALLVNAWGAGAGSAAGTDFALTASATAGTVVAGQTTAFTVSALESGTAKNAVALTAKGPSGVTVGVQPESITPGTAATVTIAVSATAAAGTQNLTLTGTDASGTETMSYALTVTAAPRIRLAVLPTALAAGTVGIPYPQTTIAATGGVAPYTYAVSSGALPTGLTLNTAGVLSGTPAAAGSFAFIVTAADSGTGAGPRTGSQSYTVVIDQPAVTDFTIELAGGASSSATVLPGGSVGESFTVSPAKGAGAFTNAISLTASGLPAGATAIFSPASVPAGSGSTTVMLAIQAPQTLAAAQRTGGAIIGRVAPLCLALILFPLAARLRRDGKRIGRLLSALLLAMAALTVLSGCGVFSGALVHTSRTYTVTVAATSGALSHSTTFTLTVE